jgi:sulfonate transport system ATP-binding protein
MARQRSEDGVGTAGSTGAAAAGSRAGQDAALVRLAGVRRVYGAATVLDGVDLTVRAGELVALTGRSGSGKSTLLRLVMGLECPDAGNVDADRRIAVSFQEPRLLPWLTVAANVGFGLPRRLRAARVAEALDEVQLADKAGQWPLQLSGGQAQRVSLARAIARRPQVMLLDEPFGALDALTRADMQRLVLRLRAAHGWTVLMVTHDVGEAVRMADRGIVLRDGRIALDLPIDRSALDDRGRPVGHEALEQLLLDALAVAPASPDPAASHQRPSSRG